MALTFEEKNRVKEIFARLNQIRQEKYRLMRELEPLQRKCSHERPVATNPFSSHRCIHCEDNDQKAVIMRRVTVIEHIVDCDTLPEFFDYYQIEEHRKMGNIKLENRNGKLYANGEEIIYFLSEEQKSGGSIRGDKLRMELAFRHLKI